jgi:DNA (cytosine-5)-methyltransferase 1
MAKQTDVDLLVPDGSGGGMMQVENDITGTLRKETRGHEPVVFHPTQDPIHSDDGTTRAMGCGSSTGQASIAVAFAQNQLGELRTGEVTNTLNQNSNASGRNTPMVQASMQVRRLTPKECERLQGFPDDHTLIPWKSKPASQCPDGPRYKALGNSMAVNVMSWIGQRIDMVDKLTTPANRGTKGE